jgi:hypothetical protein
MTPCARRVIGYKEDYSRSVRYATGVSPTVHPTLRDTTARQRKHPFMAILSDRYFLSRDDEVTDRFQLMGARPADLAV